MASYGQENISLEELFSLAIKNSTQLKISEKNIELAAQKGEIIRLQRLPGITTAFNYGYLSNSEIWNPSFSEHQTAQVPHRFTQLSLQASQVIYKGNEINNNLMKASFEEQVSLLYFEKNTQNIKFFVVAHYLDIYRQINQQKVYRNNARLSQLRLKNIQSMFKQGMVTQNDIFRTELIISDLELNIKKSKNSIDILNYQLNVLTGLPESNRILPDSTLLEKTYSEFSQQETLGLAYAKNHELEIAKMENKIAETNVKLLGSDRYPEVLLYAASNLQRPFVNTLPAVDIYFNTWQAGIGIRYNISSIYQSPKKIKLGEIQLEQSRERETLAKQNLEVNIKTSSIKHEEAKEELKTFSSDLNSATENYRIVEKKYLNQLALVTDMTDAANLKTEAEIKVVNAQILVIYTYYQLLKEIGIL